MLVGALPGLPSAIFAIPIILSASRGGGLVVGFALVVLTLLMAFALFFGWLRWRAFTYEVLPDQLVISRGLINRTRRSIPAGRIQDVSIKQSLVARVFGLAEVRIETGGGEADEGRLDSVSLAEAHRLRERLRDLRTGVAVPDTDADVHADNEETTLYQLGLPRLLYFGLFNFSLVWIAAIFGAIQYLDQTFITDWDRWLEILGIAERELQSRLNAMLVLGLGALAVMLGLLAGIVRTILRFYGFKLAFAERRFRYSRGLLTRTEVAVAQRQIQLGLVERGAVSGRLGWCAFKVQTLGGSDHVSGRQELAPFARPSEIDPLIALAGLPPFDEPQLRSVSPWHAIRGIIGSVVLALMILIATFYFRLAGLLLLTLSIPLAVAIMRTRLHRYALAETSLQVTRGVLKRRDWTIPYGNVQNVTVTRGPLQRCLGIVTVRVDTAGGSGLTGPHIHDIRESEAADLVLSLIRRIQAATDAKPLRPTGVDP